MPGKKPRSVVLLSGGMDSCVCAALAVRETDAAALHISYGQRTEKRERAAFERICDRLGVEQRLVIRNEALSIVGGSALTDPDIAVPEAGEQIGSAIPVTYVPFRNAHFLSMAVSWAEVLKAEQIYIGAVEQDSSGYPDCRPAYYKAFNADNFGKWPNYILFRRKCNTYFELSDRKYMEHRCNYAFCNDLAYRPGIVYSFRNKSVRDHYKNLYAYICSV